MHTLWASACAFFARTEKLVSHIDMNSETVAFLHGHNRAAVFLVDIAFLTKGSTLLLQSFHSFAVDLNAAGT